MMKKKFSKYTRKGLPGGANEASSYTKGVVSTEGYRINSPDKDNPVNVINSGNITMTETDGKPLKKGPLFGMDNLGNKTIMMPGFNYQFPGSQVLEMPIDNLREQLNPVRPTTAPRVNSYGFLEFQRNEPNVVGGVGVNFPRGLGFNATGVLPVSPDPVFKGVGSIGINQQFGNLNLGARIGTPVLRDYYTRELMLDPELSLSGRYTIPYTDKKKLSKRKLQPGGPVFGGFYNFGTPRTPEEYMEAELSDEEIQELRDGGYVVEELPKAQPGRQTDEELLRHQIGKIMDYEYNRGSQYGTGLSNYGNPKLKPGATREDAINWAMENIGPDLIYYQTPVEKGEAADFIYNTGKDPRAYAIQEYYRKYGKDQLKDNKWPGRRGSDFTDIYKSTIGKLPENERRILMNKGRDWYYQNIERGKGSINEDLKAYKNTWYGRIHNTNDLEDYIPDNPKFKYPYKEGGELTSYQDQGEVQEEPVQDFEKVTVYPKEEDKKKQRKLLDQLQLAKAAFKNFSKDAGLGNIFLKGKDKQDIKSLKGYIKDYKDEFKKLKEQYKPATQALKALKYHLPEQWKDLKLADVFDPQSVEELRKLKTQGKIGDDAFDYYYDSFGKFHDKNVRKGYNPEKTRKAWGRSEDWKKFTDMVNKFAIAAPLVAGAGATFTPADITALGTATASEAQMFGGFLRNPMPTIRAVAGSTRGKILGTTLTAAGIPMAVYQDFPNMQKAIKDNEYWSALGYGAMGLLNISPVTFPAIAKGYQAIKNADQIKTLKNVNVEGALSKVDKARQLLKEREGAFNTLSIGVSAYKKPIDALKYNIAQNKVALENYTKALKKRSLVLKGRPIKPEELEASTIPLKGLIRQGEEALTKFSKLDSKAQSEMLMPVDPNDPLYLHAQVVKNTQRDINKILESPELKHIADDVKIDFINAIKIDSKVPQQFVRNLNEQSLAGLKSKYGQNLEGLSSETRELILSTNMIPEELLSGPKWKPEAVFSQSDKNLAAGIVDRTGVTPSYSAERKFNYTEEVPLASQLEDYGKHKSIGPKVLRPQFEQMTIFRNDTPMRIDEGPYLGLSKAYGSEFSVAGSTKNFPEQNIIDANITRFEPGDFRFYEQTIGTGGKRRSATSNIAGPNTSGSIGYDDLGQYIQKIDDGTISINLSEPSFKNFIETKKVTSTGSVELAKFGDKAATSPSIYKVEIPLVAGENAKTISLTNNEIKVVNQTGMDIEAVKKGEINKDYITHLTKNITLTEQALPGSKVYGSAAGVKGAGFPHATHDIDVIMTVDDYNKAVQKYEQSTDGVDGINTFKLNVFPEAGKQGKIDVNVIFKAEDGTATGTLANELFRQFHPKKYYEAVMQQRKVYNETGEIPLLKINLTPDELIKSVDPEIKTIMDSFEAGAKNSKHIFRDNVYASYGDPVKFQKAQEMYLRSFVGPKGKIGRQFDASTFSDFKKNKELLKEMDFIGDMNAVARDPLKMQNAVNTFTIENSTLMRGGDFGGLKKGEDAVTYMNKVIGESAGGGGRLHGEGLNTAKGIASSDYGTDVKDFQGFMQLNIDDLINAKNISPKEYIKALKSRSDGDIVLTEPMLNKVIEIGNKYRALGLDEAALKNVEELKAADLVDQRVLSKIFKFGYGDKKLLANFYNDIAVAPELNFQAVHGTSGIKGKINNHAYYRSGLKIFDEATDAMAIDFVQFNRGRSGETVRYLGRGAKDVDDLNQLDESGKLIKGVETVSKEGEVNFSLSTPTIDKLESNQKDLKAMINLLDDGLIKAKQRRVEIMNDIKAYSKSKKELYQKAGKQYSSREFKKSADIVKQEDNKLRLLEDELRNIDLKISEVNALKDKQAKVMSQYTKLLAVPTNIIEKSGIAEEPIRQTVDLIDTGVETGVEKVKEGVKEGTEAIVQFTEKVGESLKSRSQKRMENNKAVYKKLYGKDFSGPQMMDKNSEIKSDLRTLTPGYAKRFPTKYNEKLTQLIKLKEAGFQFYKEEEKKLNKLIKENKEEGGEVKYLTDEEIEMYRAGGYVVEEL